jgi:FMN phosphatase YigB (HAD superfamily)
MLESAARLFGVALESAVMIGDRSSDLLAAKNAGCRAVLLNRFLPSADLAGAVTTDMITPDDTFTSLLDAVRALYGAPSS